MAYVYSTLGQDMLYVNFVKGGNDFNLPVEEVLIKGGANVINKRTLITPLGIRTEITDKQHEILKRNGVFQLHVKNGFIVVQDVKEKVEKVIQREMQSKDDSAQMTHKDFEKLRKKGKEGEIPAKIADKKGE